MELHELQPASVGRRTIEDLSIVVTGPVPLAAKLAGGLAQLGARVAIVGDEADARDGG